MRENPKLDDACRITTGKLDSNQVVVGGQYPFFTCASEPLTIDSYAFDDSVVLVAGNNASGTFHVNRYDGKFNAYQRTYVLTAKPGFDLDYVFYSLKLELKRLKEKSQGSQTKFLTLPILKDIDVTRRELPLQKKIASVLVSLDSKIDLNKRINAELETMAKTLYDYWFMQFDFPDEHGKPYSSSGGKMGWNDELKREIPDGWELGELSEIANITMGQSPPGESYNETGEGTVFYQGCTDFGNRFPVVRKYTTSPTRFAKSGDILLSVRAPVGTLNITNEDCCIGRGLAALNSKNGSIAYLFGVMTNLKQTFDRRNVDGTTFGAITKDDLFDLKVIKPKKEILGQYQKAIHTAFEKQNLVESENQRLAELRDWLLPMLMNGQVTVKDRARETT